ncbi:MAG: glycosyltransferase family 39 protein [Chitinophagales bacterium]
MYWCLLAIVLLFVAAVRFRLLSLSLERDEGEYAFIGQLLLKGYAPFENAYNMKFPGTSMMYALFMLVFGETQQGIHTGFLIMNAGTIVLLFTAVKRFLGKQVAIVAATTFALIAVSPAVMGSAAHATHFVMLFVVAGFYQLLLSLEGKKQWKLLPAGFLLGLSILMKQSGVFFAAFGGFVFLYDQLIIQKISWKKWMASGTVFATGIILPVAGLFLWMLLAGTFDRFWFWTVTYGSKYASAESLSRGFTNLKTNLDGLQHDFIFLWLLAPLGLILLWIDAYATRIKLFLTAFLLISVLSVFPGLYFRQHYFVLFIPSFSILAGIAIAAGGRLLSEKFKSASAKRIAPGIYIIACLAGIVQLFPYLFEKNMFTVSRSLYGANPFPESITIARYIKSNTNENDRVAIVGSEPQIYFYADRLSATGYIYTYSLMEDQLYNVSMQDEMIGEIEAAKPEVLVFCRIPQSWVVRDRSPQKIFDWVSSYSAVYYEPVGVMEIPADYGPGNFYWNEQMSNFNGTSDRQVYIFKRRK